MFSPPLLTQTVAFCTGCSAPRSSISFTWRWSPTYIHQERFVIFVSRCDPNTCCVRDRETDTWVLNWERMPSAKQIKIKIYVIRAKLTLEDAAQMHNSDFLIQNPQIRQISPFSHRHLRETQASLQRHLPWRSQDLKEQVWTWGRQIPKGKMDKELSYTSPASHSNSLTRQLTLVSGGAKS